MALAAIWWTNDGADPAREAVQQLAGALTTPDAATLKTLIKKRTNSARSDLLTDEVVADNALAGKRVEITEDIDRWNNWAQFEIRTPDVPSPWLLVGIDFDQTSTPGALRTVEIEADRDISEIEVNGHRVSLSPALTDGEKDNFYLPPGVWSLRAQPHPHLDSPVETVDMRYFPEPESVRLTSELSTAGQAEAIRQADAALAACARPTVDPRAGCGGTLELCIDARTTRTVTFSAGPDWTIDGSRLVAVNTVRRTVTVVCTDRSNGTVVERRRSSDPAELTGTITVTATGLNVEVG